MRIIITGGSGFIGSALVRLLLADSQHEVLNLDKLTYAASRSSLESAEGHPRYRFVQADICDDRMVRQVMKDFNPDGLVHLAAESHVDRSIEGPAVFINSNIVGTFALLDAALEHYRTLPAGRKSVFKFHHVSTDEVFGSLDESGYFDETTAYDPRSPYSASKAGSDHLVRAWHHTYGLPVVVTNCSNNYGPYQFPEKLIPLMIAKAIEGDSLPVYGRGENIRDWLFVDDHARALRLVFERGRVGETYCIGGRSERRNIDVANALAAILDRLQPRSDGRSYCEQITFVTDRPGHDLRYAIDPAKIERELGWSAVESFESGLEKTIGWYLQNRTWWGRILSERYSGERLGLAVTPT